MLVRIISRLAIALLLIPLSASAQPVLSPMSVMFPPTAKGNRSAPQNVRVLNTSVSPVDITAILLVLSASVTGGNAGDGGGNGGDGAMVTTDGGSYGHHGSVSSWGIAPGGASSIGTLLMLASALLLLLLRSLWPKRLRYTQEVASSRR